MGTFFPKSFSYGIDVSSSVIEYAIQELALNVYL